MMENRLTENLVIEEVLKGSYKSREGEYDPILTEFVPRGYSLFVTVDKLVTDSSTESSWEFIGEITRNVVTIGSEVEWKTFSSDSIAGFAEKTIKYLTKLNKEEGGRYANVSEGDLEDIISFRGIKCSFSKGKRNTYIDILTEYDEAVKDYNETDSIFEKDEVSKIYILLRKYLPHELRKDSIRYIDERIDDVIVNPSMNHFDPINHMENYVFNEKRFLLKNNEIEKLDPLHEWGNFLVRLMKFTNHRSYASTLKSSK